MFKLKFTGMKALKQSNLELEAEMKIQDLRKRQRKLLEEQLKTMVFITETLNHK